MDDEFVLTVDRLEAAVRRVCAGEDDWPGRVAAGIRASLEFVAAEPRRARRLTHGAPVAASLVERFAEMLAAEVPPQRQAPSVERAVVGGIASVVANHIRSERLDELEGQATELVFFALTPYLGYEGAKRWLESAAG